MPKRPAALTAVLSLVVAGTAMTSVVLAPAASAAAGPGPITQDGADHVTSDVLPTAQIDGVVWSQAILNDTVYVGGSFGHARPAGVALGGAGQVVRTDAMAYSISTGQMTSWAPALNGQVLAVAISPDKTRVYLAGSFTTAAGAVHDRIAAFNASTGAIISSFVPNVDAEVDALVVTNTTVYAGGAFSKGNGQVRTRLAAFSATTGALLGWAPTADASVKTMVATPDGSKIVIGGQFEKVNGVASLGLAALTASTGAKVPWAAGAKVLDGGPGSGITSLSTDGTSVFGTGYKFNSTLGNLEGAFAADPNTGALKWVEDCHGDTYSVFSTGSVVYSVGHAHMCSNVGSFPETTPPPSRVFHHALSWTANATGTLLHNPIAPYTDWYGTPSPSQYNWYPDLDTGTFTGQSQAAWNVTGNSQYVLLGGEFPKVNGIAQQGIVRFAVPGIAPSKGGPRLTAAAFVPRLLPISTTSVRVSFAANYDRDDTTLAYRVYRDDNLATPVYTTSVTAPLWNLPTISFVDTGLTPGQTYNYKIWANDPANNVDKGVDVAVTMPTAAPLSGYANQVLSDGASNYWRLGDGAGTLGKDYAGTDDLVESTGVTKGLAGAIGGDGDMATTFNGTTTGAAYGPKYTAPINTFSLEAWFKTTSTTGGKIIGLGALMTGSSATNDRHVYLDNAGHVIFGVYNAAAFTVTSPGTYRDGAWHQVVAELSGSGMSLFMDGVRVATSGSATIGRPLYGYWRIGGDSLAGWPAAPTSSYLNGTLDDIAVYPTALTVAKIDLHYTLSGRVRTLSAPPTDQVGQAVAADNPDLYWRLDDASGTTAADASRYGAPGTYSGAGITYHAASPVTGPSGTGVAFTGSTGTIGSNSSYTNPTTYSEEAWFKTTSTTGGKIIGFGSLRTGNSPSHDRDVYLLASGQIVFGAYTGSPVTITSPGKYNNGAWHQVVATQAPDGMRLYVDGALVASNSNTKAANFTGYWRVGGDSAWSGSNYFNGTLDETAVWLSELSPARVLAHYNASPITPNVAPTAAFTSTCTYLGCSFDASTSSDSDGSIAAYAWTFGDGATATGATPSHTFATGGTYSVTLTVTDNRSATGSVNHSTVVTANQPPSAAFTQTCANLVCSFDGTSSADLDGTLTSYAWDYGDGATGSGATPLHTFAAAGMYSVTLTVTDSGGATATVSHDLSVTLAVTDTFNRTVTGGWGTADLGGDWTTSGTAANYSVAGGVGVQTLTAPAMNPTVYLNATSSLTDSNTVVDATFSAPATGTGTSANYVYVAARHTGTGATTAEYRLRLKVLADNSMQVALTKVVANAETVLSTVNLSDVFTPGQYERLRLQVSGTSSVLLQAKAWAVGASEPSGWLTTATDASSPLAAGSAGLRSYLSASATNAPVDADFMNLSVGAVAP
jgi:PKD repeat protein